MSNYEYSSYASSSPAGSASGAGGFDIAKAMFNQADSNQDGAIDRNEFSQWAGSAGGSATGGAAQYDLNTAGGTAGGFESSSYDSSSYSATGGAGGAFGGDGGYAAASSFESSTGGGISGGVVGGESNFASASSFESSSAGGGGGGYNVVAGSQAASYTAETNAAWSRYGAEVTGTGLFVDANPQIIRRPAAGGVQTYTQNIRIRFLQPPPVPPPGVSDHL